MPQISNRGVNAKHSPIRRLADAANKAEAKGKKVYYLNIGQPDIPTPPEAMAKVRNMDMAILKYSPSAGLGSYRKKLIEYYHRFNVDLQMDNILITTGASEGISLILSACLDHNDELIVPEPFYANYLGFAYAADVKIRPVTSRIETGFALPKISEFEGLITDKTKAILLCNPNNPTGGIYTKEDLKSLAKIIKKHDLFLIVDEVYREFCYNDQPFFSVLRLKEIREHVIVIDSISKRFSACGARIGTVVSRNERVIETVLKYAQLRLSPPSLGMFLAEAMLDLPISYLENIKAEYNQRRLLLIKRLQAMKEVTCYMPEGAFYAFVALPIDDCNKFCRWLLEEFSFESQTLMLAPGTGFYATSGLGKNEVRIAYVLNLFDLDKAMDCLEKALEVYPGRTIHTQNRAVLGM